MVGYLCLSSATSAACRGRGLLLQESIPKRAGALSTGHRKRGEHHRTPLLHAVDEDLVQETALVALHVLLDSDSAELRVACVDVPDYVC